MINYIILTLCPDGLTDRNRFSYKDTYYFIPPFNHIYSMFVCLTFLIYLRAGSIHQHYIPLEFQSIVKLSNATPFVKSNYAIYLLGMTSIGLER